LELTSPPDVPEERIHTYWNNRRVDAASAFSGLYRTNTPFSYVVLARPTDKEFFEYQAYIGTWVTGPVSSLGECRLSLEGQLKVISASLSVSIPDCRLSRLSASKALSVVEAMLAPTRRFHRRLSAIQMQSIADLEVKVPSASPSPPPFYMPSSFENSIEGIPIARLVVNDQPRQQLYLEYGDISRHVCILGMTGSGKTTTAMTLAKRLNDRGIPFMVLDTHNEYGEFVKSIGGEVLAPGRDEFVLNPLESIGASSLVEHAAIVSDIFGDIYHFTHPQSFTFRNAVLKLLGEAGREGGYTKDISGLVTVLEELPIKSTYDNETKLALLRRLAPLTEGQGGRALCGKGSIDVNELLSKPTAVELGHFRDFETRTLFSSFLVKSIHDHRLGSAKSELRHALFIEEARYLIPTRRPEDPPFVTERLSQDLRKFGEAVVYVAQFPSQISSEALKNTGVRIVHRVSWNSDMRLLADSMNLTEYQMNYLSQLKVGQAIINVARMKSSVLAQVVPESFANSLKQEPEQ
jgi:energy-coupling factor transporter ATP-binding protein EcfA2